MPVGRRAGRWRYAYSVSHAAASRGMESALHNWLRPPLLAARKQPRVAWLTIFLHVIVPNGRDNDGDVLCLRI